MNKLGESTVVTTPALTNAPTPTVVNPWLVGFIGLGAGLTVGLLIGLANGDKRERRARTSK